MKDIGIVKHQQKMQKHDSKLRKFVDEAIYIFAVLGPIMTLPQVYTSLILGKVEGLSLITWISWTIIAIFWIIYGIIHKDKPIIIANISWVIVQLLVIYSILLYI